MLATVVVCTLLLVAGQASPPPSQSRAKPPPPAAEAAPPAAPPVDGQALRDRVAELEAEYSQARAHCLERLAATNDYRRLASDLKSAEKVLAEARLRGTPQDRIAASQSRNAAKKRIDDLEADALARDERVKDAAANAAEARQLLTQAVARSNAEAREQRRLRSRKEDLQRDLRKLGASPINRPPPKRRPEGGEAAYQGREASEWLALLGDRDRDTRLAAATALREIGPDTDAPVRDALIAAMSDRDALVRIRSAHALWRHSGNAALVMPTLVEAMDIRTQPLKTATAANLVVAEIGPPALKDALPVLQMAWGEISTDAATAERMGEFTIADYTRSLQTALISVVNDA